MRTKFEMLEFIKKHEGYNTLTKIGKGNRTAFVSENGDVVLINTTKSSAQKHRKGGNWAEVVTRQTTNNSNLWDYICRHQNGSFWVFAEIDGEERIYRTDISVIVNSRPYLDRRYLLRLAVYEEIDGLLPIFNGYESELLFFMNKIENVNTIAI